MVVYALVNKNIYDHVLYVFAMYNSFCIKSVLCKDIL